VIDLVRKRHDGPAWIVLTEVGNGTGSNVARHADAVAIGLWPSRGYEIHGYELKASRSDVQKELNDPTKADAVGKYCDYWWLVVEDLKIIDGLVIPETWGILYPRNKVLRVHRKAPKREAAVVNRSFVAALIRNVCSSWVPKHEHEDLKKNAREQARAEIEREQRFKRDSEVGELSRLRSAIERFEKDSGVSITQRYGEHVYERSSFELANIADAVKVVMQARQRGRGADSPVDLVDDELRTIERAIVSHERAIESRRATAVQLRELRDRLQRDVEDPAA
jgi:hypothetical protein